MKNVLEIVQIMLLVGLCSAVKTLAENAKPEHEALAGFTACLLVVLGFTIVAAWWVK